MALLFDLGLNSLLESVFLGAVLTPLVRIFRHVFCEQFELPDFAQTTCDVVRRRYGASAHDCLARATGRLKSGFAQRGKVGVRVVT